MLRYVDYSVMTTRLRETYIDTRKPLADNNNLNLNLDLVPSLLFSFNIKTHKLMQKATTENKKKLS